MTCGPELAAGLILAIATIPTLIFAYVLIKPMLKPRGTPKLPAQPNFKDPARDLSDPQYHHQERDQ